MSSTLSRLRPPFPYDSLPQVPAFSLSSPDLEEGGVMPSRFTAPGENISPALRWSQPPAGTRSLALSCFDPDAPSPAGFWHWMILDLPAEIHELPEGAGASDLMLDGAAMHLKNDAGTHAWYGPYPPEGDGAHRYIFALHALDVDSLEAEDEDSPSLISCQIALHTLARALLTVHFSLPSTDPDAPYLKERA